MLVYWLLRCFLLSLLLDHIQFTLIYGPNTSKFLCNIVLYSIGLYFYHQTYPQLSVSFPLWPSHFILSRAISNCPPFFPSSILDTFWPGGLIFQWHIFCFFILFMVMEFLWQEYWNSLPFPPPVDHILSELSTMSSWSYTATYCFSYIGELTFTVKLWQPLRHGLSFEIVFIFLYCFTAPFSSSPWQNFWV